MLTLEHIFNPCFLLFSGDHTETVQLDYDPNCTTYRDLLNMFWKNHDPTALHKAQYMSAIFYHDNQQKQLAERTRDEHQKTIKRKIATKILPADTFYVAEQYVFNVILDWIVQVSGLLGSLCCCVLRENTLVLSSHFRSMKCCL